MLDYSLFWSISWLNHKILKICPEYLLRWFVLVPLVPVNIYDFDIPIIDLIWYRRLAVFQIESFHGVKNARDVVFLGPVFELIFLASHKHTHHSLPFRLCVQNNYLKIETLHFLTLEDEFILASKLLTLS